MKNKKIKNELIIGIEKDLKNFKGKKIIKCIDKNNIKEIENEYLNKNEILWKELEERNGYCYKQR